ncbi:hypothetical protein VNO80_10101 [Phaseolus coccineus]|uniref:Uncharacterized protein n=1 Tax=Phaseolus coccineus TaxID=3886 RepID=A0AAN9NCU7_PHACN
MQAFRRITTTTISTAKQFNALPSIITADALFYPSGEVLVTRRWLSSRKSRSGEDEWNEAWETAWLPEDLTPKTRAPWESDVNLPSSSSSAIAVAATDAVAEADEETKAFVAEMNENWNERRRGSKEKEKREENGALYNVENMKKDYHLIT